MKGSFRRLAIGSVAAAAVLTLFAATLAQASSFTEFPDPSGKLINGWGAETTQDVTAALTQSGACDVIGSWDSVGSADVTPVTGGDTFPRPSGSLDALEALSAAWSTDKSYDGTILKAPQAIQEEEISFARSSSQPALDTWTQNNGGVNDLALIPQAEDAVGVAEQTFSGSTATGTGPTSAPPVANFTTTQLFDLYTDTTTTSSGPYTVGDIINEGASAFPDVVTSVSRTGAITTEPIVAVLPQATSGTRSFFATATGFANATVGTNPFDGTTVADETGTAAAQEQNDATADLNAANIQTALDQDSTVLSLPTGSYMAVVPFSDAQLVEQEHGLTSSTIGTAWFPDINSLTQWNNVAGSGAATGTLNTSETPVQNSAGTGLVGDYARYVYIALASSLIAGDPPAPLANSSTLITCAESTWPAATSTWTDYGFVSVGATFASNSANWITTDWLN